MEEHRIVNGLSVDVEDWFQVGAFENVIGRSDWDGLASRVEDNVLAILDMFAEADVKGTFFTLGWVARRNPALLRRIADAGHEVASHGYDHVRVFTFDRSSFAADIKKARLVLEDASGVSVTGYRAPSFSIDGRTPWANMELAEQGYAYPGDHRHPGRQAGGGGRGRVLPRPAVRLFPLGHPPGQPARGAPRGILFSPLGN